MLVAFSVSPSGGDNPDASVHDAVAAAPPARRSPLDLDPAIVPDVGPGWDWYLDRLTAIVDGTTVPTLADFEASYAPRGAAYRAIDG